jgi:hypothetical protein
MEEKNIEALVQKGGPFTIVLIERALSGHEPNVLKRKKLNSSLKFFSGSGFLRTCSSELIPSTLLHIHVTEQDEKDHFSASSKNGRKSEFRYQKL